MKAYGVTIQMKALQQNVCMILFLAQDFTIRITETCFEYFNGSKILLGKGVWVCNKAPKNMESINTWSASKLKCRTEWAGLVTAFHSLIVACWCSHPPTKLSQLPMLPFQIKPLWKNFCMVKFVIWYLYEVTFGMAFFVFVFVFVFYLLGKTLLNLCKNDTLPSYYLNVRRAVILTFLEGYVAYLYNLSLIHI